MLLFSLTSSVVGNIEVLVEIERHRAPLLRLAMGPHVHFWPEAITCTFWNVAMGHHVHLRLVAFMFTPGISEEAKQFCIMLFVLSGIVRVLTSLMSVSTSGLVNTFEQASYVYW